jgi:hypothetical protein
VHDHHPHLISGHFATQNNREKRLQPEAFGQLTGKERYKKHIVLCGRHIKTG